MKRILGSCLLAVLAVWLLADPMTAQPVQRPRRPGQRNREGNLKVGQAAPNFTLEDVEGKTSVTLAKANDKPTVLIFGSCT